MTANTYLFSEMLHYIIFLFHLVMKRLMLLIGDDWWTLRLWGQEGQHAINYLNKLATFRREDIVHFTREGSW